MIELVYPFQGTYPITQRFGETLTDPQGHTGVDFALPKGTVVRAAADGVVTGAHWDAKGYGIHLILRHAGGVETIYAHLLTTSLTPGTKVIQGQVLAMSGSTGFSTGPHLHFEVRHRGKAIDPLPLIAAEREKAARDTVKQEWYVSCDALNVRSGPGLAYAVVRSMNRGTTFGERERRESTWVRIGENEWVAIRYMSEDLAREYHGQSVIRRGSLRAD